MKTVTYDEMQWKFVPAELSSDMRHAWDAAPQSEDDDECMRAAYRAMIAAAPAQQASSAPDGSQERDAARYRAWRAFYLKDSNDATDLDFTRALVRANTPDEMDAVLDAAIAAAKEQK